MPKIRKKSTASYRADVRSLPNYNGTAWNDLRAAECQQVLTMAGELPGSIEDRHLHRVIMARPLGYWPKWMTKGSGTGEGQKPVPGEMPTAKQQRWMEKRRDECRVPFALLQQCGVFDANPEQIARKGTRSFGKGAANNVEQGSESGGAPEQESAPAPGGGEGGSELPESKVEQIERRQSEAKKKREQAAEAKVKAAEAIEQGNMTEAAKQAAEAVESERMAKEMEQSAVRIAERFKAEQEAEAASAAAAAAEAEAAAAASKTGWFAVMQEARKRCQQDPDGGRLISTGHMSAVPPWVSNGATRAQVIDAFTQSWEPEEIAKIFGHVDEGQAVAQRRRDGSPIDAVMAWDADIATAVEACPNHLMDFPNEQLPAMLDRLKLFGKVWAVGTTRCGKTVAARQCAAVLGQRFIECTLNEEMMLQQLVGARDAHGVFHTGPLLDAYENGGIILLDEFDKADPGMSGGCNAYLNMEDCIAVPDRSENPTAKRHPDFKIIVATNTFGNGSDGQYLVQQQSLDLVARFEHQGLQMKFTYSESVERNILGEYA